MEIKSKIQVYIEKHIKSIHIEKRDNKFYCKLIDKEGRTFEFSRDVIDIERYFNNTHNVLCENTYIKNNMLMKCFEKLCIGFYENYRHLYL